MSAEEQDFITNASLVCRDIQNRFNSERVKVGDVDPEEHGGSPRFRSLLGMLNCLSRIGWKKQIGQMILVNLLMIKALRPTAALWAKE